MLHDRENPPEAVRPSPAGNGDQPPFPPPANSSDERLDTAITVGYADALALTTHHIDRYLRSHLVWES